LHRCVLPNKSGVFRGPLPFLTLNISNMAIASFVVVYYIPCTLQWCGVGKNDCWNWQITYLSHNLHVTLSFETIKHFLATLLCLAENVLNRNAVFSTGCIFLKPQLHAQDLQQCVNLHVCKFTLTKQDLSTAGHCHF
jgi:hypothetical protein